MIISDRDARQLASIIRALWKWYVVSSGDSYVLCSEYNALRGLCGILTDSNLHRPLGYTVDTPYMSHFLGPFRKPSTQAFFECRVKTGSCAWRRIRRSVFFRAIITISQRYVLVAQTSKLGQHEVPLCELWKTC